MGSKLNEALETVKQQMSDPESATIADDKPPVAQENDDMSSKKKSAPKKKAVKTKSASKPREAKVDENVTTLKDLCKSLKIEPRAARVKLRAAEIENPGRWSWKKGSGELTKITKLLSAKEE